MSFTDQKPFDINAEQLASFNRRGRRKLHCVLCGHEFVEGETVRWVYANSADGPRCGNFFVCTKCDGEDVLKRAGESFDTAVKLARQWDIYGPDWQKDSS